MKFPVFDLHCDTAFAIINEAFNSSAPLRKNVYHIDLERAGKLPGYAQCFACFTEILESIRAGYVSYVLNTRAILSGVHYEDGVAIRRCANENGVTLFTSLDTVKVLLDVLEEITIGISTIDA